MTSLEFALENGTGFETSVEDLERVIVKGDVGINTIDDITIYDQDLCRMAEEEEYSRMTSEYGHAAKYFY